MKAYNTIVRASLFITKPTTHLRQSFEPPIQRQKSQLHGLGTSPTVWPSVWAAFDASSITKPPLSPILLCNRPAATPFDSHPNARRPSSTVSGHPQLSGHRFGQPLTPHPSQSPHCPQPSCAIGPPPLPLTPIPTPDVPGPWNRVDLGCWAWIWGAFDATLSYCVCGAVRRLRRFFHPGFDARGTDSMDSGSFEWLWSLDWGGSFTPQRAYCIGVFIPAPQLACLWRLFVIPQSDARESTSIDLDDALRFSCWIELSLRLPLSDHLPSCVRHHKPKPSPADSSNPESMKPEPSDPHVGGAPLMCGLYHPSLFCHFIRICP